MTGVLPHPGPLPLGEGAEGSTRASRVDSGAPPESSQRLLTTKALGGAPKAARGGACAPHSFSLREKVAAGRMRVNPRMFLMATV